VEPARVRVVALALWRRGEAAHLQTARSILWRAQRFFDRARKPRGASVGRGPRSAGLVLDGARRRRRTPFVIVLPPRKRVVARDDSTFRPRCCDAHVLDLHLARADLASSATALPWCSASAPSSAGVLISTPRISLFANFVGFWKLSRAPAERFRGAERRRARGAPSGRAHPLPRPPAAATSVGAIQASHALPAQSPALLRDTCLATSVSHEAPQSRRSSWAPSFVSNCTT
jgi:hypothetical protein